MLRLLGLLPAGLAACNSKFPSAPTVVMGKVVDENGMPVMGIELTLGGIKKKGVSPIPTFDVRTETDRNGEYRLSHVVPSGTDFIEFVPATGTKYIPYIERDGQYEILGSFVIRSSDYGTNKTVNLQVRKL
ncbi:hypothetical protein GCM10007390_28500 [Persicitalea jodogahamensis]|uniref:Carboxypeptidase regulatory-like domain-containing protein n=1 Tax=Persicitalea jodogahamensis TaxID=402147 RepID=A0A8J3D9Q4_9BACT|nr:hypothetical protein GCM10007390_28500 [Persicitalea jodogahamensis]